MTHRMKQAIEQLSAVPEGQQDLVAEFVLFELTEDARWLQSTQEHSAGLQRLMSKVLADDRAGLCEPLDPEQL